MYVYTGNGVAFNPIVQEYSNNKRHSTLFNNTLIGWGEQIKSGRSPFLQLKLGEQTN